MAYPKKNNSCNFLDYLALFSLLLISFSVFGAVVTVVSTALHSPNLVCLHLLHGTLFPWGEIKEIEVN